MSHKASPDNFINSLTNSSLAGLFILMKVNNNLFGVIIKAKWFIKQELVVIFLNTLK